MIGIGDCQIEYLAGDEQQAGMRTWNLPMSSSRTTPTRSRLMSRELHSLELELEPDKTKLSTGRRARK